MFCLLWCASLIGSHVNISAQACHCHRQRDASHHVRHRCSHPRKSPLWRLDDQRKFVTHCIDWWRDNLQIDEWKHVKFFRFLETYFKFLKQNWSFMWNHRQLAGLYRWESTPFIACLQKFHGHTDCSIISEHSQSFPSEFGILQSPALHCIGPFLFLCVFF